MISTVSRNLSGTGLRLFAGFVLALIVCAAAGPSASAQVWVSGQVVDPADTGVPAVNIDFFDSDTGDEIVIANDGTDSGGFFSVSSPTGIFDIWFHPPQSSGLASAYRIEVTVAGNIDLGVIQLPTGYLINGIVENSLGSSLQDVDVEITDLTTRVDWRFSPDQTGGSGDWSVILGQGSYDFFFDPTRVYGSSYAPGQITDVAVSAPLNLGTLVLEQGNTLSGYVVDSGGAPVGSADTDVRDIYTGAKLFTPGDNTDSSGFFSVVVPAGTWDVEIDPPKTTRLVATMVQQVAVSGSTSVGTIAVESGFFLQGTVSGPGGGPLEGVDIDVVYGGWYEILTPGDGTDATGFYLVVVPAGSFMVEFIPAPDSGLAEIAVKPVQVSGDTTLNATLQASTGPAPEIYGTGLGGTGGFVPEIGYAGGFPCIDNASFGITVTKGRGQASGFIAMGWSQAGFAYKGGTAYLVPHKYFPIQLGGPAGFPGGGGAFLPIAVPNDPGLVGLKVYFQAAILDPGAIQGSALSNALKVTVCQ